LLPFSFRLTVVSYFGTSSYFLRAKKKRIKVGPKNFVETAIKGMPGFVARHLADPYVKKRFVEGYRQVVICKYFSRICGYFQHCYMNEEKY